MIRICIALAADHTTLAIGRTIREAQARAKDAHPDEPAVAWAEVHCPRAAVRALTGMNDAEDHLSALGL